MVRVELLCAHLSSHGAVQVDQESLGSPPLATCSRQRRIPISTHPHGALLTTGGCASVFVFQRLEPTGKGRIQQVGNHNLRGGSRMIGYHIHVVHELFHAAVDRGHAVRLRQRTIGPDVLCVEKDGEDRRALIGGALASLRVGRLGMEPRFQLSAEAKPHDPLTIYQGTGSAVGCIGGCRMCAPRLADVEASEPIGSKTRKPACSQSTWLRSRFLDSRWQLLELRWLTSGPSFPTTWMSRCHFHSEKEKRDARHECPFHDGHVQRVGVRPAPPKGEK